MNGQGGKKKGDERVKTRILYIDVQTQIVITEMVLQWYS